MKISCGILPYRLKKNELEVFLVHPGGPFFSKKDNGYWSVCKGELAKNENELECAIREFKEEVGVDLNSRKSELINIGEVTQKNGKVVKAWAINLDLNDLVDTNGFIDLTAVSSKATITLNGRSFEVPEVDKGMFFGIDNALEKINERQRKFVSKMENSEK